MTARWITVTAFAFAQCFALCAMASSYVKVVAPNVQYKTFDPAAPPAVMPHLTPPEAAVTVCEFGISAQPTYDVVRKTRGPDGMWTAAIAVRGISIRVRLNIVIWLPNNASDKLKAHEEGHRKLDEANYKRLADAAAHMAAMETDGAQFTGEGTTASRAEAAALQSAFHQAAETYLAHCQKENEQIGKLYDQITAHGTNDVPEVEAANQAKEQYEKQNDKP